MTATTDRAALYRGILERPDDDVARLVYADWLEENGEAERAEFIRLQVEVDPWNHTWPPMTFERKDTLRRREHDLFDSFKTQWFDERAAIYYLPHEAEGAEGQYPGLTRAIVSKGFISSVHTTLQSWVGGPCDWCRGTGEVATYDNDGGWSNHSRCEECKGKRRTPAHGPRIVAEQPVERVEVTDADSCIVGYGDGMPDDYRFGVSIPVLSDASLPWPEKMFGTREEAVEYLDDLSDRLVNWARREVGLPPLREHATA